MWLTLSSYDIKVKDFIDKDVTILFVVNGHEFKIKTPLLYVDSIGELTQVMMFPNFRATKDLINALIKAKDVTVKILEPKALVEVVDINEEKFIL